MSDVATSTSQGQLLTINLNELLKNLFLVLTEKEAKVIERRFALQGQPRQTLDKIGKHFNVTRERIRQIESIALGKLKRTVRTTKLDEVNQIARSILNQNGGLMREDDLISAVLTRIKGSTELDGAVLRLSFAIDGEMNAGTRSNTFVPFWRLDSLSMEDIMKMSQKKKK